MSLLALGFKVKQNKTDPAGLESPSTPALALVPKDGLEASPPPESPRAPALALVHKDSFEKRGVPAKRLQESLEEYQSQGKKMAQPLASSAILENQEHQSSGEIRQLPRSST